jgi:hypothetical protein
MKAKCLITAISLLLIITLPSTVSASLDVDVSVGSSELATYMDQTITVSANEMGMGVVIVLQPATGTPWTDFLDSHPVLKTLFYKLPSDIRTEITDNIGNKIVSFKTVSFPAGGGSQNCIFPDDFKGINGKPSTEIVGEYTVFFAYISWEADDNEKSFCFLAKKEFDCSFRHFNVIPEVPFGTVMASVSMVGAGIVFVSIPRLRKKRKNSD